VQQGLQAILGRKVQQVTLVLIQPLLARQVQQVQQVLREPQVQQEQLVPLVILERLEQLE
jgi:hypothetical protein